MRNGEEIFAWICMTIIAVGVGVLLGITIVKDHPTYIPTSVRITACEEAGGKYGLVWSGDKYHELCDAAAKTIDKF